MEIIEGKFYDTKGIEAAITGIMDKYAKLAEKDFDNITATWGHNVSVDKRISKTGRDYEAEISTADDIFRFVDGGTAVRWATMTQDFVPKTKPGVLKSGRGRGGVAYISKNHPRPGIAPRNFMSAIKTKHGDDFVEDLRKASVKAYKRETKRG